MAKSTNGKMQERREAFRGLLKGNKCEAEMRQALNVSQAALDKLFADAGKQHWKELTAWKPETDLYDANKLPPGLVSEIRKGAGLESDAQCTLVRVVKSDGGVLLSCVSQRD